MKTSIFLLFVLLNKDLYFYSDFMVLKNAIPPKVINYVDKSGGEIKKGIIFTYKDPFAKRVEFASKKDNWKKRLMTRNKYGVWFYLMKIDYSTKFPIMYKFVVDDVWIHDINNKDNIPDGTGSLISIINTTEPIPISRSIIIKNNKVTFIYKNIKAKKVSLIGSFNGWNPYIDIMKRDKNGIWRITKHLTPGTYYYAFMVDGEWTIDTKNENWVQNPTGVKYSVLKIKK